MIGTGLFPFLKEVSCVDQGSAVDAIVFGRICDPSALWTYGRHSGHFAINFSISAVDLLHAFKHVSFCDTKFCGQELEECLVCQCHEIHLSLQIIRPGLQFLAVLPSICEIRMNGSGCRILPSPRVGIVKQHDENS